MAKFGTDAPELKLSGETHMKQGISDKSTAAAIESVTKQIKPAVTQYQNQQLANELSGVAAEEKALMDSQNAELARIQADPTLQGFEAKMKALHAASAKMRPGEAQARMKAALKQKINETPGLAGELSSTFQRFNAVDENALALAAMQGNASGGSKTNKLNPAQQAIKEIEDWGMSKYGKMLAPGWTNNKADVKWAEEQRLLEQQVERAAAYKSLSEARSASKDEIAKANGSVFNKTTALAMNAIARNGVVVVPNADPEKSIFSSDRLALSSLNAEQRLGAVANLEASKAQMMNDLRTQVAYGELDDAQVKHTIAAVEEMFDAQIAMVNNAQDKEFWETQKSIVESKNAYRVGAEVADRLDDPKVLGMASLLDLKMVDAKSPAILGFQERMVQGVLKGAIGRNGNYHDAFPTPEARGNYLNNAIGFFNSIQPDQKITPETVKAASEMYRGLANTLKQDGMTMNWRERSDLMKLIASPGFGLLYNSNPDMFAESKAIIVEQMPQMGRKMMDELQDSYAGEFIDGGLAIQYSKDRGFYASVGEGVSPDRAGLFNKKYIDNLNNYVKGLVNLGRSEEEGKQFVLSNLSEERMFNMVNSQARHSLPKDVKDPSYWGGGKVMSPKAEKAKVTEVARKTFDGLYGEGAYDKRMPEKPKGNLFSPKEAAANIKKALEEDVDFDIDAARAFWQDTYPDEPFPF